MSGVVENDESGEVGLALRSGKPDLSCVAISEAGKQMSYLTSYVSGSSYMLMDCR